MFSHDKFITTVLIIEVEIYTNSLQFIPAKLVKERKMITLFLVPIIVDRKLILFLKEENRNGRTSV